MQQMNNLVTWSINQLKQFVGIRTMSYSPSPCGTEHFWNFGDVVVHDAWKCRDPSKCFKNENLN